MTLQESEQRRRRDRQFQPVDPDHRVMSFDHWCKLNNLSRSTGRRIIGRGEVTVTQLSQRRIGITIGNNRAWQQARAWGDLNGRDQEEHCCGRRIDGRRDRAG
jgi:hypothetical protein